MTTIQKIEDLNKACNETLGFTCYGVHNMGWQINSFGEGTPLSMNMHYPYFASPTIEEVVDKAYDFVFKKEAYMPVKKIVTMQAQDENWFVEYNSDTKEMVVHNKKDGMHIEFLGKLQDFGDISDLVREILKAKLQEEDAN